MKITIIALVAVFALSACATNLPAKTDDTIQEDPNQKPQEVEEMMMEMDGDMTDSDMMDGTSYQDEAPQYIDYTAKGYDELLGKKPFALFFHAAWCPTCISMEKDINSELDTFPKGTKILKANFDTETELKKKYNINIQSVIVVIDEQGKAIETLAAPSNNELIEAIKASL